MKYIRTYEKEEKFLIDKDSTSRGFRLKPTLYKYDSNGDHIHLEIDDPRKHEGSTYMEITLDADVEFSFYIGNKSGDTQTTMTCTIDWGDGTIETKTITADDKGFKLAHNYVAGSYKIELYDVERDYSAVGDGTNIKSLISSPSSVKRVVLGSGVVSIGDCAFYECTSLTSVYIPEGVTTIEDYAFEYCTSLTSIHIPEGVTSIEWGVFEYCSSLTSIHIPKGVTSIKPWTFAGCTSLTSIDIPEGVTKIETNALIGCISLKSISSFSTTTPTLGSIVFYSLPTNGILHVKPGATGYDAWLSQLPSGWTIVEDL